MFAVNSDKTIECTRGDTGAFSVGANVGTEPHTFQVGDVIRFKVFEKKNCDKTVLQKDFEITEATTAKQIALTSSDTKIGEVINKPADYWYEVELNPETAAQTLVGYDEDGPKIFRLYPEGATREEE